MKVLLIRPPKRHPLELSLPVPPLGLAYIASSLRASSHQVEILDCSALNWSWQKLETYLQRNVVDVIGMTAMSPTWDIVLKAMKLCRPYTKYLVIGGPHPTSLKEAVFEDCLGLLDAAVVGEGEDVIVQLLAYWAGEISAIPKGVVIPQQPFVEADVPNIKKIALPARDLLPNHAYRYPFANHAKIATMITSRGCPFRCSFCDKSVSGSQWRFRTAIDVVDEMQMLKTQFNIEFINIYDDNFTLKRSRVIDICKEILRRGLRISWKCEGRVDNVDQEMLSWMKRAGCRVIAFGVESGNQQALDLLRKDITVAQSREAFRLLKQSGIKSLAYIILGVPNETVDDVWQTIRFCREIQADYVQFSSLSSMPGTSISEMFTSHASVYNPLDADNQRPTLTTLDEKELQFLMRAAWRDFYFRPKQLLQMGRDCWQSAYWQAFAHSGISFLRGLLRDEESFTK